MTRRIFLHLGAHRTGSTHLQRVLSENGGALAANGWHFAQAHDPAWVRRKYVEARSALECGREDGFSRSIQSFRRFFLGVRKKHHDRSLFYSYEGQLGSINLARTFTIYPKHERLLQELLELASPFHTIVGFAVRNYGDFIESTFKYCLRAGMTTSFDEYAERIDFAALSWVPIVKNLAAAVGERNVALWGYDAYARDQRSFLAWLFRRLGLENVPIEDEALRGRSNESCSQAALRLEQRLARVLQRHIRDEGLRRRVFRSVNNAVESELPVATYGRAALLSNDLRRELTERYEQDIAVIRDIVDDAFL